MFTKLSPEKIQLPVGAVVRLPATWQDYQNLCQQRGDRSIPRLKYRTGEVLLMSPLPKHGRDAHLIANIITTLLDRAGREYDAFTPVTMELPQESGITQVAFTLTIGKRFLARSELTGRPIRRRIWCWKLM